MEMDLEFVREGKVGERILVTIVGRDIQEMAQLAICITDYMATREGWEEE